ncbi:hypothetical protein GCM10009584_24230 [Ornithinimicrobium humiphilum]|uniref:Putative cell wall binding repeat protein n=1 Tax=Ornithinimicrobium humiphilum TaxID=125288 RepID=A0A543KMH4_9MICO|nr:cell wall-binding repeat-containing protein [Ornithinimicrobium humiphilum]TQM96287.1 putative cell wall binding repeat protein [Ornithinimicrobium humiphilum]
MHARGMRRRSAALTAMATGVAGLLATPAALAATLESYAITGVQFINADCSRNEYVVTSTVTGVTDDGGGFDKIRVEVWDDGELKDFRVREVQVGTTVSLTTFLSFVGTYGGGAPGVGIVLAEADAAGENIGYLAAEDPYFPDDVDGPCSFDVERIGGPTRIETAAMLSQQKFVTADTVLVASSKAFPDALAAAPWAAQLGGPLLLSNPGGLPAAARDELQRLSPSTVHVIGGPVALSEQVLTDIRAALPAATVERVAGADRWATAAEIGERVLQDSTPEVFLASGEDFPDGLVLSALAARHQAPLLLVRAGSVPSATASALATIDFDEVYAAGGTEAISDEVLTEAAGGAPVTRWAGADRYGTAAAILAQFPSEGRVLVASGEDFPDSLSSVPVAARTGAGVALTRPDAVPAGVLSEIERLVGGWPFPLVTIVGGEVAVNPSVEDELRGVVGSTSEAARDAAARSGEQTRPTATSSNLPAD